jgi:archaemetzincin
VSLARAPTVQLYTYGYVEADAPDLLRRRLAEVFGVEVIFEGAAEIPGELLDRVRNQLLADAVVRYVSTLRKGGNYVVLALVDADAYVPGLNFVFGLAIPELGSAAVFLRRLRLWTDREGYLRRVVKESVHELGHVFGLGHCRNPLCVMSFSNSLLEVDRKLDAFCSTCASRLLKLGIPVPKSSTIRVGYERGSKS